MNIITQGQSNTVIFTLQEKKTLAAPYYLVRMQSRSSQTVKRFILGTDQSTATGRYNQFVIIENATEDLTHATVSLIPVGFWDYSIYEQLSAINLNETVSDNTVPLETGLMLVKSQTVNSDTYYTGNSSTDKFYGQ